MGWIEGGFGFLAELVYLRQGWEFKMILVVYALPFVIRGLFWVLRLTGWSYTTEQRGKTGDHMDVFSFGAWFMITKLSEVQTSLRKVKVDRWWSRKRKRQKRTRARPLLRPYTHITRLLRYLENEQQEHAWPQSGYETRNLLQLKLSIPTKNTTEALDQRMDSHRAFEQSISYNSSFFNTPHITYIIILNLSSHINYHGATL